MLFNSIPFLILFSFTYLVYWNIPDRFKKYLLILSSLLFYFYFGIFTGIHFVSIIIANYAFSFYLQKKKDSGRNTGTLLAFSILFNFINLAVFKYFYFFMGSLFQITGLEAFQSVQSTVRIILPLAISFYTFQLVAIQIDIHRGTITEKIPFTDYFLFIIFFPQLIAGPIMRTSDFLPELNKPRIDRERMMSGIILLLTGLLKKVVIADNIGSIINPLYMDPSKYHSLSLFITSLGFISQVYCDFSGYTDMARGLANLLGFEIPENFRGPFLAKSFRDFWGRWHVTLSTWLRDYLYIPLGGNKGGPTRASWNMMVTMSLGGLWHGANITYLLWGMFCGLTLWAERLLEKIGIRPEPENRFAGIIKTFIVYSCFAVSGVFFRAGIAGDNALRICLEFFKGLAFNFSGKILARTEELVFYILLTLVFNHFQFQEKSSTLRPVFKKILVPAFSFVIFLLLGVFGDGGGDFIYFQF